VLLKAMILPICIATCKGLHGVRSLRDHANAHDFPTSTASCNLLHGLPPSMA
jgi:hypothetical protein